MIYDGDSFFTLTPWSQAGLAALSALLAGGLIATMRALRGRWWRRGAVSLAVFWAFVWLSPQIYYVYYRLIIDGLPPQIVVGPPPGVVDITRLLTFSAAAALNAHALGVLGWAMIAAATWRREKRQKSGK